MHYLNSLLPTIESIGAFGYWIVFLISLAESLAFVGIFIPGSVAIYIAGFLASRGYFNLVSLFWFAMAGAIIGDGISYLLGTKGKRFFRNENKLLKLSHIEKGEAFFAKHGPKSVFLGRFVGPLRPIVPFIAGLSRMKMRIFFLWSISSAVLWAISHLLVGYFFGNAIDAIEAWTSRAGIIIVSILATLAALWLFLKTSRPFFAFLKSSWNSLAARFASAGFVRRFAEKNPRAAVFLKSRFDAGRFSGLPLTLVSVAFIYVLFLFFGSVQGALSSSAIALSDKRIADLLFSFRDLGLIRFFTWVSLLAKWQVILALAIAISLIFRLWRKEFYIVPLWAALTGSALFGYLGRIAFYRARPESSFYLGTSSSFPSTHSVLAAAFYGFVVYVLVRHSKNWGRKMNIVFSGSAVILGIGFAALYLGECFLSDVWGGYLLGLLWLMIGVSLAELLKLREKMEAAVPAVNAKTFSFVLLAVWFVFYAGFASRYKAALSPELETEIYARVADAAAVFETGKMPKLTEKLFGEKAQPIGFVIVAESDEKLAGSLGKAGWLAADPTDAGTLLKLVNAEIVNGNYPNAPMTPAFWNAAVNEFGFEKETEAKNAYSRRHLRAWETPFETAEGKVYVAAARLDTVKWIFVHGYNPDIDAEREMLLSDLKSAGVVAESKKIKLVEPISQSEEMPFFTDGEAYEIVLK